MNPKGAITSLLAMLLLLAPIVGCSKESVGSAGLPVGSIVSSLLVPDVFAYSAGDNVKFSAQQSSWSPADGRSVAGSRYEQLANNDSAPDLRGLFLRSVNEYPDGERRTDAFADPEDRMAGALQASAVQSHVHRLEPYPEGGVDNHGSGHNARIQIEDGPAAANQNPRLLAGRCVNGSCGPETRPKNIAVYYYLKINP